MTSDSAAPTIAAALLGFGAPMVYSPDSSTTRQNGMKVSSLA